MKMKSIPKAHSVIPLLLYRTDTATTTNKNYYYTLSYFCAKQIQPIIHNPHQCRMLAVSATPAFCAGRPADC